MLEKSIQCNIYIYVFPVVIILFPWLVLTIFHCKFVANTKLTIIYVRIRIDITNRMSMFFLHIKILQIRK